MEAGPQFSEMKELNHRGNVVDVNGNEVYGCHRGQGASHLNLRNPEPGKVYYWGLRRRYEDHYALDGWVPSTQVRNTSPLDPSQQAAPLSSYRTPGSVLLMEMSEERALVNRLEKEARAAAQRNDGRAAFESEGLSIQERYAYYSGGRPLYFARQDHGLEYR
jgi:hypothetical protein